MAGTARTIAILATLDTKGAEADYIRKLIEIHGHHALVIDAGVVGEPAARADVHNTDVALAGGRDLKSLRARGDREEAAPIMAAWQPEH